MFLAQIEQQRPWLSVLLSLVPWILVFLFLWAFVYGILKRSRDSDIQFKQMQLRMDLLERKLDEALAASNRQDQGR